MREREMCEMLSARMPTGTASLLTDAAVSMDISRSELLRRAVEAYIAAQGRPSIRVQHDP